MKLKKLCGFTYGFAIFARAVKLIALLIFLLKQTSIRTHPLHTNGIIFLILLLMLGNGKLMLSRIVI